MKVGVNLKESLSPSIRISGYFSNDIDVMCEPLDMPICVSTPMGEFVVVFRIYQNSIGVILGRETQVDLILLDMLDFNVILGMDWLFPYHVIFDCYVKIVTLVYMGLPQLGWISAPSSHPKRIIFYVHAWCMMEHECLSYLAHIRNNSKKSSLGTTRMVNMFMNVFPTDLPSVFY